jgi:hypothetical protein
MIKKGNLSGSLLNWLMSTLQLGPGIGDVFYAAQSSSEYHKWLVNQQKVPGDHVFSTVAAAYAATVDGRNDVVLKLPGIETVTAELDWAKTRTHLVGLGGPQQKGYESGTGLYSATVTVVNVIHNTGVNNQFHNVTFANNGANAACLSAFKNAGYGTRMIGCQAIGCMNSTNAATALANSLDIAAGGYYFYAENSNFGSSDWGTLGTDTTSVLHFSNTVDGLPPSDGKFVNCNFSAWIAATTRSMIYCRSFGADRDWIFDRCEFYAFATNHAYTMAQVITNEAPVRTKDIVFKDCVAINCTAYRTASDGCTWASGGGAAAAKTGVAVVTT